MYSKKVKSRLLILTVFLISFIVIIFITLKSLNDNIVYFYSPSEILNQDENLNKKIRIGGLVKKNSIIKEKDTLKFTITDLKNEIFVSYNGIVPNLFSQGKGVIAEGILEDKKYFIAEKILAKHDENYMPPEVSQALSKSDN